MRRLARWLLGVAVLLVAAAWIREQGPSYSSAVISMGRCCVLRDEFGIPTIEAANRLTQFEAQGYATAADRIFQMDWSRRQLLGQTAEVLGKSAIVRDFQTRALGVEACAESLFAQLGDDERAACAAYAGGVNYWLLHHRKLLPPEFRRLGYRPRPWKPTDCLVIWRGMALTLGDLTDDLEAEKLRAVGSNGWAIAGSRTLSRHPILAGDPHLAQTVPGALHEVHFAGPGGAAIGWAIPGVPGLVMGRNRAVAFTPTAFSGDASDIFTFPFDPTNPERYESTEGWLETRRMRPLVWVRLWGPIAIPVFWQPIEQTPWGPVIGREAGRLRTLRWEGASPIPGEGLITVHTMDLGSVEEARSLLRRHGLPDINVICADTAGAIGHFRAARLPRRVEHRTPRDGLDPALAWHGVYDFDELPHDVNPDIGFVASGNGPPPTTDLYLGYDYLVPREKRIRSLLAPRTDWTVGAVHDIQNDHVSEPARDDARQRLAAMDSDSLSDIAGSILPILDRWDGRAETDSVGTALYRAWQACGSGAAALNIAVSWLERRYGADRTRWGWGRMHQARLAHALNDIDSTWSVAPFPRAGDRATIDVAGYARFDTTAAIPARVTHGPAARWITELSPGGETWGVLLPGEAESFGNPHRLDQLELWRTGRLRRIPPPGELPDSVTTVEWLPDAVLKGFGGGRH
ncbi:MAG: penicillin acylase family protein [Candidatus Eisenbacteria bacterium]|nr:penicillin acylase family protein [Candidatus Eisenbacteria bacterium]